MSQVVLVGDSIRMGYEPVVRRELSATVDICSPKDNGGNSANVLEHLDEWIISKKPDLVHLNCGLHDLKRPFDADGNAIPLQQYELNLDTILTRICQETDARLVFATTTPVNQGWHHDNKPFDRFEADVVAYNAVALRLAKSHGVTVNDLYALVEKQGPDSLLLPDGVHYSPEGYEILGLTVAEVIRANL